MCLLPLRFLTGLFRPFSLPRGSLEVPLYPGDIKRNLFIINTLFPGGVFLKSEYKFTMEFIYVQTENTALLMGWSGVMGNKPSGRFCSWGLVKSHGHFRPVRKTLAI